MRRLICNVVRLGVALTLLGCESDPRAARRTLAVAHGEIDSGHLAVVAIGQRRSGCQDALALTCTGTLIAPRVVLSAAHCFTDAPPFAVYEAMFGTNVYDAEVTHSYVVDVVIHPNFEPTTGYADLALLLLDKPASQPPLPILSTPLDADLVGESVRVVGFGSVTAQGNDGGVKRTGTSVVTEMTPTEIRTLPGPSMTCTGDSGGPVLVDTQDGEMLIAVTSRGDPACAAHADNTRVDFVYDEFIAPIIAGANSTPTDESPAAISLEDVCVASCESDADCPESMTCRADLGSPRCVGTSQFVGEFGVTCRDDSDCESCVRLRADDGPGACRCFGACESDEQESDPPSASGCSAKGNDSPPAGSLATLVFLLLALASPRSKTRQSTNAANLATRAAVPPAPRNRSRLVGGAVFGAQLIAREPAHQRAT